MGKEFKNRNQQHKNRKPFNKDFRGTQRGGGQRGRGGARGGGRGVHGNNAGGNRQFQPQRKQDFIPKVNLKEEQVGITEFVANGPGFTGVVKARFSDFHVNEIEPSGKVLQLTDLKIPQPLDEGLSAEQLEAAKVELADVLKPELWTSIEALTQLKGADAAAAQPIELDVTVMDKDKRTQIHKVLKKLYEGKVVSSTVSKGEGDAEQKFIKILKPKGGRDQNRNRWTFPGDFVHFLVHKENMDTSEVAVIIAGRLNLRPSQVNYCGTKDKRAKTTQKFCIKRRTPSQIVSAVNNVSNVRIGNFEFSSEVLKLGQLKGNRFRIALRHVNGENAAIESRLQEIKQHGFINYYGLQRFGNCAAIPTYEVGIALLKSDYKLACELILKPRDNDLHFMRAIREAWWKNRDSTAAAAMFRGDKFIEKKLLDGLSQYGESDYASALRKIPRNMLLLYPHAFQSLVFNRIASRRIKEFGLQVIEGDLVYRDKSEADTDHSAELDNIEDETVATLDAEVGEAEKADEVTKEKEEVAKETEEITKAEDDTEESIFKRKVKPLTAADIASGEYTLFDVVLPLPGYDVRFPENVVGAWYEELLAEHGLSVEKLRHNVKTYAMAGAYRRMLIQPEQMSWQFCQYETPETTLIASDWETLKGKAVLGDVKEGKFKALLVDFCLPTSVYATMFLRELLKMDTSAASQTQLEQNEMQKHKDSVAAAEKRKAEASADGEENGESGEAKKSKVDEEAKENEEAKQDEKNDDNKETVEEKKLEELEAKEVV